MYRCRITNTGLKEVVLYGADIPVFLEKSGNQAVSDFSLSGSESPPFSPEESFIGTFSATDPDGDNVFFRLAETTGDNSCFRIVNGSTLISSTILFEHSFKTSYEISVEAYDIYGGRLTKTLTINQGEGISGPVPTGVSLDGNSIEENEVGKVGTIVLEGLSNAELGDFTISLVESTADNGKFELSDRDLHTAAEGLDFE